MVGVVGVPWEPCSSSAHCQGMVLHEVLTMRVFIQRGLTLHARPFVAGWEWDGNGLCWLVQAGALPEPCPGSLGWKTGAAVSLGAQLAQYL